MDLIEMKVMIVNDWRHWFRSMQGGWHCTEMVEDDQCQLQDVKKARNWNELVMVAPEEWTEAVIDQCHRRDIP